MKNNPVTQKNAIILTSQPVTNQPGYVMPYEECLSLQEKYCKENNLHVIEMINLPRFSEEFAWWMKELKVKISKSNVSYIVIYSPDFFYQNYDLSMLYSAIEPYGVEVIDECEYMDEQDYIDFPDEPDGVLVTLMTRLEDITETVDLAMCRYELEIQKDVLHTIAMDQSYEIDTMVFTAINDPRTWDSFFGLLDTYIQVRNIENIILRGDGEYQEFAKDLIEYYINDEVSVMISQPKLRIMTNTFDLYAPVYEYEDNDDLPFN